MKGGQGVHEGGEGLGGGRKAHGGGEGGSSYRRGGEGFRDRECTTCVYIHICMYVRACIELYTLVSFGFKLTMGTFVLVYFAKRLVCACVNYIPRCNRQRIDSPSQAEQHATTLPSGVVQYVHTYVGCGRVAALLSTWYLVSLVAVCNPPLAGVSKLEQSKGTDVLSLLRHAHLRQA